MSRFMVDTSGVVLKLSGVAEVSSRVMEVFSGVSVARSMMVGSSGVANLLRVAVVVGLLGVALGSSWVAGERLAVAVDSFLEVLSGVAVWMIAVVVDSFNVAVDTFGEAEVSSGGRLFRLGCWLFG